MRWLSLIKHFIYGISLKSEKQGRLFTLRTASISLYALSCTAGCMARNMMFVFVDKALVLAAACITAPR